MEKIQLLGLKPGRLKTLVIEWGLPAYTSTQLLDWMYRKRIRCIDEMTNLSKETRKIISEQATIYNEPPLQAETSNDGTIKYLFSTANGHAVETVFIPEYDRGTLCVSSQAGCKMGCSFCMTGRMGFKANLTSAEILNQILSVPVSDRLTNIVFMGMGEPMDNLDAVLETVERLTAADGFAWSPKRITVSTIGVIPAVKRFLKESQCHLAISLHTALPEQRLEWMPSQKVWPSHELIKFLKTCDFSGQRRLSFEYIVFKGLNDSVKHADALARLLKGLECRVNLIRFHAIPDSPFESPDEAQLLKLTDYLNKQGLKTTLRKSRGEDIRAACGLLSTQN